MRLIKTALFLCLLLTLTGVSAKTGLWTELTSARRSADIDQTIERQYKVDKTQLLRLLSRAGFEGRAQSISTIELPVAKGQIEAFRLEYSPIMEPELAAKFPDFKTYRVTGIDNPNLSGRLSMTSKGFHAMLTGPDGSFFIDPQADDRYRAHKKSQQKLSKPFSCGVKGHTHGALVTLTANRPALRTPGSLRVYRLAVAATAEYVAAVGGTKQDAMAEIVTAINRVNQIYQRDLGIKLVLVGNNDLLINNFSYSNDDGSRMLEENQTNIDAVIGPDNYDIGHVFSTGGGGVASVAIACDSLHKAEGVTGSQNPAGDDFYIDYVAHEIGHQFGGQHTFNGTAQSCSGNRWADSAYEPGSGSTIMSYAGICGVENISDHALAMFHAGSIRQIDQFTSSSQGSCGELKLIINNASEPTADAGADKTIPVSTPFMLTAVANDADGDTLSYSWGQLDAGMQTDATTFGSDLVDNALMRSRLPSAQGIRYFPQLDTLLARDTDDGEVLPTTDREINFRLVVRDGKSGMAEDDVKLTSTTKSGPFAVTSHRVAAQLTGGGTQNVIWNVSATDSPPVNCHEVDINLLMMNESKTTFCQQNLDTVQNSGSAQVTLPDLNIPKARFLLSCSDNIFFALSSGDLTVSGADTANVACSSIIPDSEEHASVSVDTGKSKSTGGGGTSSGGGSPGLPWLFELVLLGLIRKCYKVIVPF